MMKSKQAPDLSLRIGSPTQMLTDCRDEVLFGRVNGYRQRDIINELDITGYNKRHAVC